MDELLETVANGLLDVLPSTSVCGQKRRYQIAEAAIALMPKLSEKARATILIGLQEMEDDVEQEFKHYNPEYRAKFLQEDKAPIIAARAELEKLP